MTTAPPPGAGPSARSTSLAAALVAALGSVATTLIPGLSPTVQIVLIAVIGGLAAVWIICSAVVKRGLQGAGQPSLGAGLVDAAAAARELSRAFGARAREGAPAAAAPLAAVDPTLPPDGVPHG